MHLEILVEEESAEQALNILVPKILSDASCDVHPFSGKRDLLRKLPSRLRAYRSWLPEDARIVVVIDEDRQDCKELKRQLEDAAAAAGFSTKTSAKGGRFQVLNRIAVEELESWFFGDMAALKAAYPRVPAGLGQKSKYREPDHIKGGTWEALEKVLQMAGYHSGGLAKIQVARDIAEHMRPDRNASKSFKVFRDGLRAMRSA